MKQLRPSLLSYTLWFLHCCKQHTHTHKKTEKHPSELWNLLTFLICSFEFYQVNSGLRIIYPFKRIISWYKNHFHSLDKVPYVCVARLDSIPRFSSGHPLYYQYHIHCREKSGKNEKKKKKRSKMTTDLLHFFT